MRFLQLLQNIVQYLFNGVSRIFKPTDDDYPKTGVQPFEGEPYDESEQNH